MSSAPAFLDPVVLPLISGDTVLDVACGYGRWGNLIETNFWECSSARPKLVDGFDAFEPNVNLCAAKPCYRKVWQQTLPSILKGKWDTVLAVEIIEHLEFDDAMQTIDMLEQAATKRIIFSTPNWENIRPAHDTILGFNEFEAHKSYVSRREFQRRGYTILGAGFGGHTLLARALNKMNMGQHRAWSGLSSMFPSLAQQVIAYKDV